MGSQEDVWITSLMYTGQERKESCDNLYHCPIATSEASPALWTRTVHGLGRTPEARIFTSQSIER